ncbi:MAG: hypothetical protein O7H41_00620 [Planctomycetota bacterium]|nr:hypothetical protein [Planctomycetota bacterium]
MNDVPSKREFWIEVMSTLSGIVAGVLLGHSLTSTLEVPDWYYPAAAGFGGGLVGFTVASLAKLIYMRPRQYHKAIYDSEERILRKIQPAISLIPPLRKECEPVYQILSSFATTKVDGLLTRGDEPLTLEEYLFLLDASLEKTDYYMFATSLFPPTTWIKTEQFTKYLSAQGERRKKLRGRLWIERVFLCEESRFNQDKKSDHVVSLHRKNKIAVGFRDLQKLREIDARYCRDFVLFQSAKTRWVVDGGLIGATEEQSEHVAVRICTSKSDLDDFFSKARATILAKINWLYEPKGRHGAEEQP